MKIGVVGYSSAKFDKALAEALLAVAFKVIEDKYGKTDHEIVSGLTDIGIPALAYRMAVRWGWKTVGLTAKEAKQYECFPVDKEVIAGEKFGDESEKFIKYIDCMVRIGGGKQSKKEVEMAKAKGLEVFEYDLPEIRK